MGVVEQVLMVDQLLGGGSHQRVAWQQDIQFQHYVEQPCILVDQHFDLKQPGKVDGGANRSDTAHRGVAGGEDRTQKRSIKVIRYTKL